MKQGWLNKGGGRHKNKKFTKALSAFDLFIKNNPKDAKALQNRGCCLIRLKRSQEAIEVFSQIINEIKTDMLFYRSTCYYKVENYKKALEDYEHANQLGSTIDPEGKYIKYFQKKFQKLQPISTSIPEDSSTLPPQELDNNQQQSPGRLG